MKKISIEVHVTAIVRVGDEIPESGPIPSTVPSRTEELSVRRTIPLMNSFTNPSESANVYATAKAHTVSAIAAVMGVLPEKIGHVSREMVG